MSSLPLILTRALPWVLVTGVCVFLYAPGLSGHFMFDDVHTVEQNPWIQISTVNLPALTLAAESFPGGSRRLSMLTFAINHYFFGHSEFAYKAVNLAIHCVVGLLLLVLARRVFARLGLSRASAGNRVLRWGPEIVAGVWLLSPINLTSVLYISQRMTSLSALFTVAGILVYVVWRSRQADARRQWWLGYPLFLACLAGAYWSKENGVLLVLFVLAVELCVFQSQFSPGRSRWGVVLALCALGICAAFVALTIQGMSLSNLVGGYSSRPFTLEERMLTQPRVLIFYIGLILIPVHSRLSLWHDDFVTSTSLIQPIDTATSIALIVLLVLLAFAIRRRYPLCSLGILWFFAGHALESTVIPLEMVHEHRNYLPSFGVVLAVIAMIGYTTRIRLSLKVVVIALFVLAASLNLHARASGWANEYRHALYEFDNHPTSPRAAYEAAITSAKLSYQGVEGARGAALSLLEYMQSIDDRSILPEVAMLVISSLGEEHYDQEWIDSAAMKLSASGGNVSDSVALRGLRLCIETDECDISTSDVRKLYDVAAEANYPMTVYEAARFFHNIEEHSRSMEVLKRAASFRSRRVEIKLNYIAAMINAGNHGEARDYLRRLENLGKPIPARYLPVLEKARRRLSSNSDAASQ